MIRPFCVEKKYLPNKPPTQEDVADICFDEEIEKMKDLAKTETSEKKEKKPAGGANKKGSKGSSQRND